MAERAVVLLSGGLDSATVLAIARERGFVCTALTIRYGQRHQVEVEAARRVARALGAEHREMDLDLRAFGGSALTADIEVPKGGLSEGVPVTYVPARNTIFLSLALALAETLPASDIFIGANAVDFSGYPDCRPEFIRSFEQTANLGTEAGVSGRPFHIHAPLVDWPKTRIIEEGLRLGLDYGMTHSCYDPDDAGRPCGACDSCRIRRTAFSALGMRDPADG